MKKITKEYLRRKNDALLQQYIRIKHKGEICMLCGEREITVGHHFIRKSQSNALRYYLPNIIPLCNNCHCAIHTQQGVQNAKVALHMGKEWLDELENVKRYSQKFTLEAMEHYNEVLTDLLKEVSNEGTA